MSQLALPLKLADHAVFASFHAAGNEAAVASLCDLAEGSTKSGAWLWGPLASGKSHLLQAVCERAGDDAMYLPLGNLATTDPAMLEGLETRSILCIDDVDHIAGLDDWEGALFRLYNALDEKQHTLVIATTLAPRAAGFALADLVSRFTRLPAFRLHALDDDASAAALRLRAHHRGLDLPDETARFMLRRSRRDMRSLYALLDTLDSEALSQQRRLTVPFVKTVLEAGA